MLSPIRGFAVATLAVLLSMASAQADENQTKIDLQASLLSFLDASADSQGRFGVIDRESGNSSRSNSWLNLKNLSNSITTPIHC